MPPLPALHIKALDDLAAQLRFAPPAAARRQMERAEELLGTINPAQNYPEEWIVFAITGYRPEVSSSALVVGAALLGDLVVLIERLGVAAGLTPEDLPGLHDEPPRWLDAEALCARWGISRKTLDRHRRASVAAGDGAVLPARRVRTPGGREKLYFAREGVEAFERARGAALTRARSFSRIEPALERKIVRLAARYHDRLGWSLNRTAERLAERFERGHETVRQILQRHDASPGEERPIFAEAGPLTDRQRRVVVRAVARGVPVERLAGRYQRTRASIYRVLARERADFLRGLPLVDAETPEFADHADDEEFRAALAPSSARAGLAMPPPATLQELIDYALAEPVPDPRAERERATAYWHLRARAARLVGGFPAHQVTAGACDEAETLLRWASRLKAELVRAQLGLVLKNVRASTGREVTTFPRAHAGVLVEACVDALIEAAGRFDPSKGGRLAAQAGLALNRALAKALKSVNAGAPVAPPHGTRAQASIDPAGVVLTDWTRRVDAWQPGLEPDPRIRPVLDELDTEHARALAWRYGWPLPASRTGAEPPITLEALARRLGMTHHHASALEREARIAALRAARELADV